jgi:hypothetical protein
MFTPAGLDRLEEFIEAKVDRSFPETSLERSIPASTAAGEAQRVYNELCRLADVRQTVCSASPARGQ